MLGREVLRPALAADQVAPDQALAEELEPGVGVVSPGRLAREEDPRIEGVSDDRDDQRVEIVAEAAGQALEQADPPRAEQLRPRPGVTRLVDRRVEHPVGLGQTPAELVGRREVRAQDEVVLDRRVPDVEDVGQLLPQAEVGRLGVEAGQEGTELVGPGGLRRPVGKVEPERAAEAADDHEQLDPLLDRRPLGRQRQGVLDPSGGRPRLDVLDGRPVPAAELGDRPAEPERAGHLGGVGRRRLVGRQAGHRRAGRTLIGAAGWRVIGCRDTAASATGPRARIPGIGRRGGSNGTRRAGLRGAWRSRRASRTGRGRRRPAGRGACPRPPRAACTRRREPARAPRRRRC